MTHQQKCAVQVIKNYFDMQLGVTRDDAIAAAKLMGWTTLRQADMETRYFVKKI